MAAPAAPPPSAPPTPTPTPAPAPAPSAPPTAAPKTPMDRARARMAADSVMADPSDPDPMRTVKAMPKDKAPEPPKPPEPVKAQDEPPKPTTDSDPLETGDEPPKTETKSEDTPPPPDKPITDEKGKPVDPKKVSPWKLLDQFKGRLTAAEKENIELKERLAKLPNLEKLEGTEKRNKELEEEIRYQNYAKSQEYAEKYQKPYEEAWAKAVADLGELEVLAEDGSPARKATASDLISLARMPLGEARKLANQMFGDSASDVMMHRQKIRDLADAQHKALEDAKKLGSERETQWTEKMKSVQTEVVSLWEKFNKEDSEKLEFLKAREGDEDWNSKLDKAKAMADASFGNAMDPNLTPEQRTKLIRTQAAMRNRSIAYSTLKLENARLKAQIKERDDKLKAYEQSEPTAGQSGGTNGQPKPAATPMERARQRMHAEAVPAPQFF